MKAREFLSRYGFAYESHLVEATPVDRVQSLELARRARRLLIKVGQDTLRFDSAVNPITEAQIQSYLVHDDGFLRVPVLHIGDLLVRGYTEELYREALGEGAGKGASQ